MTDDAFAKLVSAYVQAWNSGDPESVGSFFREDAVFIINRGEPWTGRSRVAEMAAGFFSDVPDLVLTSDGGRCAGSHAINVWTFTGHDSETGRPLEVKGWEEWEFDESGKIATAYGWYDAADYARQAGRG